MSPLDLFSRRSPGGGKVCFSKASEAKDEAPGQQRELASSSQSSFKRLLRKVISFKDLHITLHEGSSGSLSHMAHDGSTSSSALVSNTGSTRVAVEKKKLVIIMVGLPGRGKTFLCNKLRCYLNWLGHATAHFNVGQYRRHIKGDGDMQDAAFFDHNNAAGRAAREHAFQLALDDMLQYLGSDAGQVAIFDATNSTQERRDKLSSVLRNTPFRFIFIENICNDESILRQNYENKMRYSPDYQDVCMEQALSDFVDRIRKYEEIYEPITDRSMHYIKLTDMVTGRGHLDINRISGYLPGKIVAHLMQVCKSGIMGNSRKIWLTRHGESMFNRLALIGGDSPLSESGQAYAEVLPEIILNRLPNCADGTPVPVSVWTSTLQRTIQTAAALPFAKLKWKALDEIDAGICDGLTYAQIAERYPAEYEARKKDKLRYRYPRGESYLDMIDRLQPVISEMEREGESIVIVGHQAVLRVVFGYLMAQPQADIPLISIPLHTVIELTPRPDGTMGVEYIPVPVHVSDAALGASMGASIGSVPDAPPLGALPLVAAAARPGSASPDVAVVIGDAGSGKSCAAEAAAAAAGTATDGVVPAERLSSCSSGSTLAQIASLNAGSSSGSLQPQQQHWPSQLVAPSAR